MRLTDQEQAVWNDGYIAGQERVRNELEPIIEKQNYRIRILECAVSSLMKDCTGEKMIYFPEGEYKIVRGEDGSIKQLLWREGKKKA